jgi:hypothetical protein
MLTELQEKLADAHALAIAAATVTDKVAAITPEHELKLALHAMHGDADDTRARCLAIEDRFAGPVAEQVLARVNTAKEKAADLAGAWFKAGTGPLATWTFLTMGEAGEVATWTAVRILAATAGDTEVLDLAEWALPIQRRHLETALYGTARLAQLRSPTGPRWG